MFDIQEELKKLPDKPGVYIMHGKMDEIIYVGKAKILKRRVMSYFNRKHDSAKLNVHVLSDGQTIAIIQREVDSDKVELIVL